MNVKTASGAVVKLGTELPSYLSGPQRQAVLDRERAAKQARNISRLKRLLQNEELSRQTIGGD